MNDFDDAALLRRYAADREEAPFAEFVRRRLPLVYSAALRRLGGDAHLAEDVTQSVFCAVARNARKLGRHRSVTGWLYTATRFAATDAIRAESRRRVREQEVYAMEQTLAEADTPADWARVRPALDAAMDRLNDNDREAVLLRFFEGQGFAEIGTTLGLSEDTARKRVERALDKLRIILGRRKIVSTSAALGVLLTGETMAAVPAHLAAQVTGAALTAGSVTTAATAVFLGLSKLQVGVAVAVLVAGAAGLITQQLTISDLRIDAQQTQQQLAKLTDEQRGAASARAGAEAELAKLRDERVVLERSLTEARAVAAAAMGKSIAVQPAQPASALRDFRSTEVARKQRADYHRRYDPFLRQRGISPEAGERFIDAMVLKAEAREDLQQSVRVAGLNGDHREVEELRRELYRPATELMREVLGEEGYAAFGAFEDLSFQQLAFVEPLEQDMNRVGLALGSEQASRFIEIVRRHQSSTRRLPTDIGTTVTVDWSAVVVDSRELFTEPQMKVLEAYAKSRTASQARSASRGP